MSASKRSSSVGLSTARSTSPDPMPKAHVLIASICVVAALVAGATLKFLPAESYLIGGTLFLFVLVTIFAVVEEGQWALILINSIIGSVGLVVASGLLWIFEDGSPNAMKAVRVCFWAAVWFLALTPAFGLAKTVVQKMKDHH